MRRAASVLLPLIGIGAAPPGADLRVELSGLRSTKGIVMLCLTATPANFPDCRRRADARFLNVPASAPVATFTGVSPGRWAVAAVHDQDGDGKLDTLLGVPREGIGFTRNPRLGWGPPSFDSAAVAMDGADRTERVRLRYFL